MTPALTARPGFSILSRLLAAVLGGYAVASALAVLLAALLPVLLALPRGEAVLAGIQWSFAAQVAAAIWAFSPVPLARVWAVLLALVAVLAVASWALTRGAGG